MSSKALRKAYGEIARPAKAESLPYKERKETGRALTRLDNEFQLEGRVAESQADLVRSLMKELGRASAYGMEIRVITTKIERRLVSLEPGAINDLAAISELAAVGTLQLLSEFVHQVTSR